jgi:hypothetical protein
MNEVMKKYHAGQKIRVHDSGDFYNQEYVDKWADIARANPDKKFYAYTKSLHLDLKKLHNITNFHVIQSVGGDHDDKVDTKMPHAYVFPSKAALKAAGYEDASDSDAPAAEGKHRIGIVVHGAKEDSNIEKHQMSLKDAYKFDQPDAVHQAHHASKDKPGRRLRFHMLKRMGHG